MMAGRKRDWLRKRTTVAADGKGRKRSWSNGMRVVFSAAWWSRWRQPWYCFPDAAAGHGLLFLLGSLRYHVLWVVEAVVVVATLCFFYLRFGFRL